MAEGAGGVCGLSQAQRACRSCVRAGSCHLGELEDYGVVYDRPHRPIFSRHRRRSREVRRSRAHMCTQQLPPILPTPVLLFPCRYEDWDRGTHFVIMRNIVGMIAVLSFIYCLYSYSNRQAEEYEKELAEQEEAEEEVARAAKKK
jgi:hypothetical protein